MLLKDLTKPKAYTRNKNPKVNHLNMLSQMVIDREEEIRFLKNEIHRTHKFATDCDLEE